MGREKSYGPESKRQANPRKEQLEKTAKNIQRAMDTNGGASYVLAEILLDIEAAHAKYT